MSISIHTKDNKTISIDKTLLIRFSNLAKTTLESNKSTDLVLNITEQHLQFIIEYIEHHANKESPSPIPPIQKSWTLDNSYEDKWDSQLFQKIIEVEKDPEIIAFSRAVEYMDMETLLKKTTLVITLSIIQLSGLDCDKMAEEFAKRAARKF